MDHEMIPFLYSFLFRLEEKDHDIIAYNWRIQKKTSSDLHRIALFRRMFTEKLWNMCQEVKGIEHRYVRTSGCGSSSSQGRCSKLSHDLAVFEALLDLQVLVPWNIQNWLFVLFDLGPVNCCFRIPMYIHTYTLSPWLLGTYFTVSLWTSDGIE